MQTRDHIEAVTKYTDITVRFVTVQHYSIHFVTVVRRHHSSVIVFVQTVHN